MDALDGRYTQAIVSATDCLLGFLRTFESIQEHIHFDQFGDAQGQLRDAIGDTIPALPGELKQAYTTGIHAGVSHIIYRRSHTLRPGSRSLS